MLAALMMSPDVELSLTELAQRSNAAVPTILRDVDRLVSGGYLEDRRIGRSRLIRANTAHPLFHPLREIVLYGYGPEVVLAQLLEDVADVQDAYIYGSWAARANGVPGHDPQDIDVLVIGHADNGALYDLAKRATDAVGKEVNVRQVSQERWESGNDGFMTTVRSRPLIRVLEPPQ